MNLFNEYALLIAVAIPFAVVIGLNAFLMLAGEKGTLMLPSLGSFPSIRLTVDESPSATGKANTVAANDESEREAA